MQAKGCHLDIKIRSNNLKRIRIRKKEKKGHAV